MTRGRSSRGGLKVVAVLPSIEVASWLRPQDPEIHGGDLRWPAASDQLLADDPDARWTNPGRGFLNRFIRLKDDRDGSRILEFARTTGVLGLCGHQLPDLHAGVSSGGLLCRVLLVRPQPDATGSVENGAVLEPSGMIGKSRPGRPCSPSGSGDWSTESLDAWRRMAAVFGLIIRASEDMRSGQPQVRELWKELHPDLEVVADPSSYKDAFPPARVLGKPRKVDLATADEQMSGRVRGLLHVFVDDLLRLGGVRVGFDWTGSLPELNHESRGLLGALAVDLALVVSGSSGVTICSECGNPYAPSRTPVRGNRRYCQDCRDDGAPQRFATQNYRQRKATLGTIAMPPPAS
jgi:hypothetical protein